MRVVREVANFMRMYPSYKRRDVLDEYAISFFALLNEGYRLMFEHYKMLAHISDLPHIDDKSAREGFYRSLEWASQHPNDILKPSGEGSSPAEIKKLLGG